MRESRCLLLAVLLVVVSLCVYLVTRSSSVGEPSPTLVRAFVAFRHGSRAPMGTYVNDLYSVDNKTLWPDGPSELTKMGKMEAFKLGERLRERYGAFLGEYYLPEETRAFANITERTLMCGELVLASLFPPAGIQIWNQELNWQPVPLYPDYIFRLNLKESCPSFRMATKQITDDMFANLSPEEIEMASLLLKHAGGPNGEPLNPTDIITLVWDEVYFRDRAGYPIPEWIKGVYPEKITPLILNKLKASYGSDILRKTGLYTNAQGIRDFLLAEDGRKMEIHSVHDLIVMDIMEILGIKIDHIVEPTGCIILELHQRKEKKFFEVYYYDSYKSSQPRQLEMSCGLTCSADDLEDMVSQLKLDNYTNICNDETFMYKV